MLQIRPGSVFFAGRESTIDRLLQAVRRDSATLLYGGRQAGKTSVMLALAERMRAIRGRVSSMTLLDVPVYVDLTALHYDATPVDVFGLLFSKLADALAEQIDGFSSPEKVTALPLGEFIRGLQSLREGCGEVDARPVFLLDEAKRILGTRFPRGFQDNLFSILYGELSVEARCTMVFAGAQHLYEFSKDDTSPIGSRAATLILDVLFPESVGELIGQVFPQLDCTAIEQILKQVMPLTGGHAGLVAKALERVADPLLGLTDEHAEGLYEDSLGLFENWTLSWSPEALAIVDGLSGSRRLTLTDATELLQSRGLQRFLARRVIEELRFTGVALWKLGQLEPCNDLYWRYFGEFGAPTVAPTTARTAWVKIEETELALRELIAQKFDAHFGTKATDSMERILGKDAWLRILDARDRGSNKYKFSRDAGGRDLMSCMYIGQLGSLMLHSETWALFKAPYRDRRELEDRLSAITPVRTDRAHFVPVPHKELERCLIACDDLLAVVEREMRPANDRDSNSSEQK
jgi:hypothetical protein